MNHFDVQWLLLLLPKADFLSRHRLSRFYNSLCAMVACAQPPKQSHPIRLCTTLVPLFDTGPGPLCYKFKLVI